MNTRTRFLTAAHVVRRHFPRRATIAAFIGGIALAGGVSAYAVSQGHGHGGDSRHAMANASPAEMANHVDLMLKRLYVEINATDAQKAQLDPIVKQAMADLMPLHTQVHAAHANALAQLTQASVDRAALEGARTQAVLVVDQASRRLTQLFADVSDVLTPEQRKSLADHVARRHG